MKTTKLLLALPILLACSNAFAQTAKFDIATYTTPTGYSVEKDEDSIVFSKESSAGYCVITLTRAAESVGDSGKNFELLWKGMVSGGLDAAAPQRGKQGSKNGWLTEVGVGVVEKGEVKGAVMLTTFTGNGQVVAIIALTNSESFQPDIVSFVDNLKLPPVAAKPALDGPGDPEDLAKLLGKWQRSGSTHPSYADPVSWGTAGYTTSRYEFKSDKTYVYTERSFRQMHQNIIVVKENGTYAVNGDTLTIKPAKSTITAYKKAGGVDALGAVVSTQNRKLDVVSYKFTFHFFEGIKEWNLVLQADAPTQRDGAFSNNTTFKNAWYFDQKYTDKDLTAARN